MQMFVIIGKIIEEKIEEFICTFNKFVKDNEEWRQQMSEMTTQLLTAVDNVSKGQSALHTSLADYFTKVEALVAKLADLGDADVQKAIDELNASAAIVNSDGTNLQAHLQALADTSGTAAPTEPVPTAPTGDGTTPPAGDTSGSTGSSDTTPPADGSTAPAGDAGSSGSSGSTGDGSTGDQPAPPPADGSQPTDGSQVAGA